MYQLLVVAMTPQLLALRTVRAGFFVEKGHVPLRIHSMYRPLPQQHAASDTVLNVYQRCERDADCDYPTGEVCACAVVGFQVCCRLHDV